MLSNTTCKRLYLVALLTVSVVLGGRVAEASPVGLLSDINQVAIKDAEAAVSEAHNKLQNPQTNTAERFIRLGKLYVETCLNNPSPSCKQSHGELMDAYSDMRMEREAQLQDYLKAQKAKVQTVRAEFNRLVHKLTSAQRQQCYANQASQPSNKYAPQGGRCVLSQWANMLEMGEHEIEKGHIEIASLTASSMTLGQNPPITTYGPDTMAGQIHGIINTLRDNQMLTAPEFSTPDGNDALVDDPLSTL